MEFHQTQAEVAKDDSQFRVVDCGRQWGKTTLAVWEMFVCAYAKSGRRVTYFATTYSQAREIAWQQLKEITRPVWAKEPNETLLTLVVHTKDGGTSEITLRSWEAVEKVRGQQFDLIVLDEVSKMRNFQEGWQGALMGTLAFRRGKALFISTPFGFNHFHELFELGQGKHQLWKSWKFTSFDNPHLPKDYLYGIQETVTSDFWAQEYLADFRRFTGLIYKEFEISTHVEEFEHTMDQHGDYYFGLDFAVRGWTAAVLAYIDSQGEIWILDEYKEENLTAVVHAEAIKVMLKKYASFDKWVGYADPSGFKKDQQKGEMIWAIADEYLDSDLPITRANNEVTAGINYVRQLFKANKIHIHPRCTKLIDELLQYQWKQQSDSSQGMLDDPEKVRKINDHLLDGTRYMLYSKPVAPDGLEQRKDTSFPIAFPLKLEVAEEGNEHHEEIDFPSAYDS